MLKALYDQLETHIRGLQALGVESESYGSLLSSVLVKKLPSELQLLVARQLSSDDWKLQALMDTLEQEIVARERTTAASQPHSRLPRERQQTSLYTGGDPHVCCHQRHASN